MLVFISCNKCNQFTFSSFCKKGNFDFLIIEKVTELIHFSQTIENSFVIIDWAFAPYNDLLLELKKSNCIFENSIVINKDIVNGFSNVANIQTALEVAKYQIESNGNLSSYAKQTIKNAIKETLEIYGFSLHYIGYKYLSKICELQLIKNVNKFSLGYIINEVARIYGIRDDTLIKRNLRYLTEINENIEIYKIKGGEKQVKVKAVIAFLLSQIENKLYKLRLA